MLIISLVEFLGHNVKNMHGKGRSLNIAPASIG